MRNINFDALAFVCVFVHRQVPLVLRPALNAGFEVNKEEYGHVHLAVKLSRRFDSGDYRASDAEMARMIEAGVWLSNLDCAVKGISARQTEMSVEKFFQMDHGKDLPENAYDQVMAKVAAGEI